MSTRSHDFLRDYLKRLAEDEVRKLLVTYFLRAGVRAVETHSMIEHGVDVVVHVDAMHDAFGREYNIVIQAKIGDLGTTEWRKVLYQLLETPYFPIRHANFNSKLPRRIWLVLTGQATASVRESIDEFNKKHYFKVELLEWSDVLRLPDMVAFLDSKLQLETPVGQPLLSASETTEHPIVGKE